MAKKILNYLEKKRSYAAVVKGVSEEEPVIVSDEEGQPGESEIKTSWITGFQYSPLSSSSSSSSSSSPSSAGSSTPKRKNHKRGTRRSVKPKEKVSEWEWEDPIVISSSAEESPKKKRRISVSSSNSDTLPDIQAPKTNRTQRENPREENKRSEINEEFSSTFHGNPNMKIFKKLGSGIRTKEAVELLLSRIPAENLSSDIPTHIDQNVSFVYSVDKIGHWKNTLCDGMGKWTQMGNECSFVKVTDLVHTVRKLSIDDDETLKVYRRKYINGSDASLHRVVITLYRTVDDELLDQFFVQYFFDSYPHSADIKPHGNSKSGNAYQRTAETTKQRIRELCKDHTKPKDVFHAVVEEQGGLSHVKSSAYIPKGRAQISNFNRGAQEQSDPLLECIDLAREQADKQEKFVRDIRSAPEFTMLLATDRQLDDVKKFCTQNKNFSILGVDTTFNIGQYYVTATTYRNLMLETRKGVHPVMIGPVLLHQKKTFDSYFKLPSGMVQECPDIKNVKVFGTDGDENLANAFAVNFVEANHIMCDMHMYDNMQRKLTTLGITGKDAKLYISDIFGNVINSTKKVSGLVDCQSPEQFDKMITDLKEVWKTRHTSGEQFYQYFMEYKSDIIKQCMSAEVRSQCGLGFPPQPYTQNASECINSVIKRSLIKRKGQKLDPYDFVKEMEKVIRKQETEVKFSIIGKGEYRLTSEYMDLFVEENIFWKKSSTQREAAFKRFFMEPLKARVPNTQLPAALSSMTDTPSVMVQRIMDVAAEESEIITIPFTLLQEMFNDAETILADENNIINIPGCVEKNLYFVANFNSPSSPYKVRYAVSSCQCTCDKSCTRFNSLKLCQHTLALAQKLHSLKKFLVTFRRNSKCTNVTKAATGNLSASRGKKATNSTSRRKGRANAVTTEMTEYVQRDENTVIDETDAQNDCPRVIQPFHLTFMHGLIKKCYGCDQHFTTKNRNPPHDIVLKRFDHRIYTSPNSKKRKKSPSLQNTYFHLNTDCARRLCPNFEMRQVLIHDETRDQLLPSHVNLLKQLNIIV